MRYNFNKRETCPVCDKKNFKNLYNEKFNKGLTYKFIYNYYKGRITNENLADGIYDLVRCNNCSLIFQRYVLDEVGLFDLYERAIDSSESLNKAKYVKKHYYQSLLRDSILIDTSSNSNLKKRTDINVLDFGCGWGYWIQSAKAYGYNVVGAELSNIRIKFAEKNGIRIVDPFNDNLKYNFINTDQVFEHLENPFYILKSLSNILSKNGIIKILVPNPSLEDLKIKFNKWHPCKGRFHPLEHINAYNKKSLQYLANQCDLKPISFKDFNYTFRSLYKYQSDLKPISFRDFNYTLRSLFKIQLNYMTGSPSWYFIKI